MTLPAAIEELGIDAILADQMEAAGGMVAEALGLPPESLDLMVSALAFQFVNPKAWLISVTVVSTFLPPGEGYVWIAAESAVARALREIMVAGHGVDKRRIRAASYWKRGAAAVHESHED